MNRYFTILIVPEKEKGLRSFRIPRIVISSAIFFFLIFTLAIAILTYDYLKILQQVYRNKHLTIENRQLKEQIQLFHMKINSLTEDIERIQVFENKLRIITGLENADLTAPIEDQNTNSLTPIEEKHLDEEGNSDKSLPIKIKSSSTVNKAIHLTGLENLKDEERLDKSEDYLKLKNLYEQKIAAEFGQQTGYSYTKEWSELSKQSFGLAKQYAKFDYKFSKVKSIVKKLEVAIHTLDEFLLDKESFLRSTPTLLPTRGWITSYYGPRISHYANRIKMHEGLDIGAKTGRQITATADGLVAFSGEKPGFGNFIKIDHGYGVETIYAHAQKLLTKKGQIVKRGDVIGLVGNTGYSTGPHVHYEVRVNDTPVDPLYFILD